MLGQSISRNSVLLAIFALCTTLLIAGTYLLTKDDIAEQKRLAEEKARGDVAQARVRGWARVHEVSPERKSSRPIMMLLISSELPP